MLCLLLLFRRWYQCISRQKIDNVSHKYPTNTWEELNALYMYFMCLFCSNDYYTTIASKILTSNVSTFGGHCCWLHILGLIDPPDISQSLQGMGQVPPSMQARSKWQWSLSFCHGIRNLFNPRRRSLAKKGTNMNNYIIYVCTVIIHEQWYLHIDWSVLSEYRQNYHLKVLFLLTLTSCISHNQRSELVR